MTPTKPQTTLAKANPTKYNKEMPVVDVDSSQTTTGNPLYNMTSLEETIINHEGLKNYVYVDTTNNYTIGIGRNISPGGQGISNAECVYLLRNDIERIKNQIKDYSWYVNQDRVRQEALVELTFNLGLNGLLTFKLMLAEMERKDYINAAKELLDSIWATQVGTSRATNIANRIRTGTY